MTLPTCGIFNEKKIPGRIAGRSAYCWQCGMHHVLNPHYCPARNEICIKCNMTGHLESRCPENVQVPTNSDDGEMITLALQPCWKCGTRHAPRKCPAWRVVCENCNERGHYTNTCQVTKDSLVEMNVEPTIHTTPNKVLNKPAPILQNPCSTCGTVHERNRCRTLPVLPEISCRNIDERPSHDSVDNPSCMKLLLNLDRAKYLVGTIIVVAIVCFIVYFSKR